MILLEDSYIQLIFLFFATLNEKNLKFYIVYEDEKPSCFYKLLVKILNIISLNRFLIKPIQLFRNEYKYISDQDLINKICDHYDNLFEKNKRFGGQIFLENILRYKCWKKVAKDKIFKYFYYEKDNKFKIQNFDKIYLLLKQIRKFELIFYFRFTVLRGVLSYLNLIFFESIKLKILTFFNFSKSEEDVLNPICIHEFFTDSEYQKHDLILDSIKEISKDMGIKSIIKEEELISEILSIVNYKTKFKDFLTIINSSIIILFLFLSSKRFLIKASNLLDSLSDLYVKKLKFSSDFKVLAIDPVQGRSMPFLSSFAKNGFEVYFTSFSIGNFFTRSCSDYNGPFTTILSPHISFSELLKRSGFKGKVINTKCYMTYINEIYISNKESKLKTKNESKLIYKNKVRIIIPETSTNWFFGLSSNEISEFAEIIYLLNNVYKFEISFKKKKLFSEFQNYLSTNHSSNSINFIPPVRGLMDQFAKANIILSLGISSIAIKSAEKFDLPYIIFDNKDNSKNEWNLIYSKVDIKPYFAKNFKEIIGFISISK